MTQSNQFRAVVKMTDNGNSYTTVLENLPFFNSIEQAVESGNQFAIKNPTINPVDLHGSFVYFIEIEDESGNCIDQENLTIVMQEGN